MFSLHETTRKRTCRTAFFALCLGPTCATAAWIADHHFPWRDAAAARRLSDCYHLDVTFADWQDPRPHTTRLAAVTLAEPGHVGPLLKLNGVESRRRGDSLSLSVNEATLAIADLPALAARLAYSLHRAPAAKIELHIRQLVLSASAGDGEPVTLHRVQGVIERDQHDAPRLQLIAHLAAQPAADARPIVLAVARSAALTSGDGKHVDASNGAEKREAPAHVVTLNTQQHALPVALLAPLVPGVAALNDGATFTGIVTWHVGADVANATGNLYGRLEAVDLAGMLPRNSPHLLTGIAAVELTDCRWHGAQFQRLAGTLTTASAAANGSLLMAAPIYLGCHPGDALKSIQAAAARAAEERRAGREPAEEDSAQVAANHQLSHFACRFNLDSAGLAIEPHLPAGSTLPADTLAAEREQPILFCRPTVEAARLPAVAWLQFIASPPGPWWIPYTPATLETARRLPTPQ